VDEALEWLKNRDQEEALFTLRYLLMNRTKIASPPELVARHKGDKE
jgi:hypothetical protein